MRKLLRSLLVSLVVASPLVAQTKTVAERLGYPANAKLVILHADDLAVAHSVNTASLDALASGAVSSASIMVPTPWLTEVAAWARAHPTADLGLHLTVTAEWETYRWGSVAPADKVPSLLDPDGTFPRETRVVATRANVAEVERELRAQIDRAIAVGISPTHVDAHMGTLFSTPELMATYMKVAREYKLPFLGARGDPRSPLLAQDIVPDTVVAADVSVPRDKWGQFYLETIGKLKPGLTYMIVHLGHDDAELQAVMVNHEPYGATWRQKDYDVVRSAAFKQALKDNGVILVTWREIQKLVYGSVM
jgi:predicted glycoside hydrolase/deacetylase ChbG (UPF0249 family)